MKPGYKVPRLMYHARVNRDREESNMRKLSRVWVWISVWVWLSGLCVMMLFGNEAWALPSFGSKVDQFCTSNARQPAAPYSGDCALCHNPADSGADRTPLFSSYKSGDLDAFCPPTANQPPQLQPIADTTVSEDALLSIDVVAWDPDGDGLLLEVANLPTGAAFEDLGSGRGQLVWMPSFEQEGNYPITFKATDTGSPPESTMATVNITVGNVNRPPSLAPIGNQTVASGESLVISLMVTDPDGDAVQYGAAGLPTAASLIDFGDRTGRIEWTPTQSDVGSHVMTVTATDTGIPMASDAEEFVITVGSGANRPPQLDPIGDRNAFEGEDFRIALGAGDPDGDRLSIRCDGAPAGATLVDAGDGTADLSGRAGYDQAGNYTVTCTVSDDGTPPASDSETFTFTIGDVNRPPILDPVSVIREGDRLFVPLTARDPDGDALAFSADPLPSGATFVDNRDGTAELSWTPPAELVGDFPVVFTVRDDGVPSEAASRSLTIALAGPEPGLVLKARWSDKRGKLSVAGGGALANAVVEIHDQAGTVLGTFVANRRGSFRGSLLLVDGPCSVRAVAEGEESAEASVRRRPAHCEPSAGTLGQTQAPFVVRRARWKTGGDEDGKLSVSGRGAPANAVVEVVDALTGSVLGQARASGQGRFSARLLLGSSPCMIQASSGGRQTPGIAVAAAADECDSN